MYVKFIYLKNIYLVYFGKQVLQSLLPFFDPSGILSLEFHPGPIKPVARLLVLYESLYYISQLLCMNCTCVYQLVTLCALIYVHVLLFYTLYATELGSINCTVVCNISVVSNYMGISVDMKISYTNTL